jgi:DnaJ-domain-containing protein 1
MNILRTNPECFQEKCIYLKEYIVYLYPKSNSFHESLKMAYQDVYQSESIAVWLKRFQSEDKQKDIVRFLIHMAAQDGIVAPREKVELFKVIDTFGLDHEEWMDLIDDINRVFAERQNRWRKTKNAQVENYHDSLLSKALDYFEVSRDAISEQLLRDKYRKLVKEYHPDRHPNATAEQHSELEVKFQELQLYYEELLKLLEN